MIKIICVGKIKEKYLTEAIKEYQKRLSKYTKLELIEVMDEGLLEESVAIKKEQEKIMKYIGPKDYIITLEIEGTTFTSIEFAKRLDTIRQQAGTITFIIGGSYGLGEEIKRRSNLALSFSKLTFPHQLFRVMLLEQLYRAFKIQNNESYHK